MSETIRERIEGSDEFWQAFEDADFDEAGRILGADLKHVSHRAAQEACDDSFWGRHLFKYASEDATVAENSTKINDVVWDKGHLSGTVSGYFGEYTYRGCSDLDYQGFEDFSVKFGIGGSALEGRNIWVDVLAQRRYFSPE